MKRYSVLNADGQEIKTIVANNQKYAFEKLKFQFPNNYMFLKLKYKSEIKF